MKHHRRNSQLYRLGLLLTCYSLAVLADEQQQATQIERTPQEASRADIVINSLDEGLVSKDDAGKRLQYEPQPEQFMSKQLKTAEVTAGHLMKPEPRNQGEGLPAANDPVILDHRPSGGDSSQVQSSTEPGPQQTTTQPPVSMTTTPTGQPATSQTNQMQATPQPGNWYPTGSGGNMAGYAAPPAHQQQRSNQPMATSNYSPMASGSQIVGTLQHPTSINAIIEQQQNQAVPLNGQVSYASSNNQQGQIVNMNGQPVYLANANSPFGGRRVSISNWLRGISSMLANIFVRRDHSQVGGQPSASNGLGQWVQFGSNAPHWLSQAQTVIQSGQQHLQHQQQQQYNTAGTNRYTAYAAAPQGFNQPQQQQMNMQPTATVVSGQAQQVPQMGYQDSMLASGSSPNYVAVQPPFQATGQPQPASQFQQPVVGSAAASRQQSAVEPSRQSSQQAVPSAFNQSWSTQTNLPSGPAKLQPEQNLPLAHYSRHYGNSFD